LTHGRPKKREVGNGKRRRKTTSVNIKGGKSERKGAGKGKGEGGKGELRGVKDEKGGRPNFQNKKVIK